MFSKIAPIVCENLSYNSDYIIDIDTLKMRTSVLPTATFKAKSLKISSKKTKDVIIVNYPKVKIRILPLLSGNLHINKMSAKDLNITSYLTENPELNDKVLAKIKNTKIICDILRLDNFKITIYEPNSDIPAIYSGNNIYYRLNGRFLMLNVDGSIKFGDKESNADIKLFLPKNNDVRKSVIRVKISQFDLAPLCDYLNNYLPKDLKSATGILDIDIDKNHLSGSLSDCAFIMNDEPKSIVFPKKLSINSDFKLSRKNIFIQSSDIKSDNIDVNISGIISNYLDKSLPEIDLNVRINKSKIQDFISFIPPFETEDIDTYKLKKYKFYGDIIGNLNIKGSTKEPAVNGSIYVSNGVLTKPIPNAKGATVKLDFKGKYLNFDVAVPANNHEKVWVKGGVELYNVKYSDFRVWSTKNVDLALAEEKVVPIHEILNFVIGPVPIMDVKGSGNIDISIKGNKKNPHVWGALNFYDATAKFNEIPNLVLNNANAILTFDDENAAFKTTKGTINNSDVKISGTCNLAGKFDFDANANGQHLEYLYNAIKTSTLINDIKAMVPDISNISGHANLNLKVYGFLKNIEDLKFNENFFTKGTLNFQDNALSVQGIHLKNLNGNIDFDNTNANVNVNADINQSPLSVNAAVKDNFANANVKISRLNLRDIVTDQFGKEFMGIITDISAKYKGNIDKIDYGKLDFNANILGTTPDNKLKLSNGSVSLKNDCLQFKNIKASFTDTKSGFDINLNVNNLSSAPNFNGQINLIDFELSLINNFADYTLVPKNIRQILKDIQFLSGKINVLTKINNNNIYGSTNLGGITLKYVPLDLPIKIVNGSLFIRRNYLGLNKINVVADELPVLLDGGINNIFTKQDFDIYINSKPKQDFIDKYVNNNRIYPIKLKGDILYQIKFKGTKDNYNVESEANLAKEATVYYMGATVGDVENSIVLNLDMDIIKHNILKIKEFSYDKIIDSLGKKKTRLNMLKASGGIDIYPDDLEFHDLKIKTNNPTDARIFNIIFRKPNIKQGQFTSDLRFNNKLSNPKLIGTFHIFETDIPFLDTSMKNISFIFRDKTIDLSSSGEVLGNDIKFKGVLKNKLTTPYYIENAELSTKIIDFNDIIDKAKQSQLEVSTPIESPAPIDLSNIIIKKLKLRANGIKIRNLFAENVETILSISEKNVFWLNNFKSDIANGALWGDFSYNLKNYKTSINLHTKNINANDISYAIFDLNNQIYGDLTGELHLSCNGKDYNKCMQSLNGSTTFNVTDGRMPKLGSLEYLLKAGNLIKGGITGLSINSIIDIITPLKTGNFSEIYGTMDIKDGITNNVEISTKGKDLNLFLTGSYNFATSVADMEVFGLLSKKISTLFGPLGNVSLNTLFSVIPGIDLKKDSNILDKINKIPGIELNEKEFRKFVAEIKGNINGDNYVTTFSWIN